MTESIPTTWNDDRDVTFFAITATLDEQDFAANAAEETAAAFVSDDLAAHIDKALEALLAAESWESMTIRSIARSEAHHRDLVPVRAATTRRAVR